MRELADRGGPSAHELQEATRAVLEFARDDSLTEFWDPSLDTGRTPQLFNRLAESLAALAWNDGGVHFMGRHWQYGSTPLPD